jgi:ribitol 2-dehydrogenase
MEHPLSGKVVIITGASTGIGAATARALAKLGGKMTLASRSADKLDALVAEIGADKALALPTDITLGAEVQRMVDQTLARFGRIDVLMANAGIYIPGVFADGNPDDWAHLLNVNIDGVLRSIHAVLPTMRAQGAGDILVTSSISGFIDIHWEPVYSASKHAVQGIVHTLRRQFIPYGIRIGSLAPGMVANELWGITDPAAIDQHVQNKSALRSEDVAEAALFMLSQPRHVTIRDLVMLPASQDL